MRAKNLFLLMGAATLFGCASTQPPLINFHGQEVAEEEACGPLPADLLTSTDGKDRALGEIEALKDCRVLPGPRWVDVMVTYKAQQQIDAQKKADAVQVYYQRRAAKLQEDAAKVQAQQQTTTDEENAQ